MRGLYKNPGKNVWRFRYTLHGVQHRVSLGTTDEPEAIRRARRIVESPEIRTSSDWLTELERYFTAKRKADRMSANVVDSRRYILTGFFEHVGKPLASITTEDIQHWYENPPPRVKNGKTVQASSLESTRQNYLRMLTTFFAYLVEGKKLRVNPCDGVKIARLRPTARKNVLTREIAVKLIEECEDPELKFVLFCGLHAGMRKEEVIEARPEWFDNEHVNIGPTDTWIPKDRDRRSVPLSKQFREFLLTYGKPSPYMLAPNVRKGRSKYRYDFKRPFVLYIASKGVKCSFHDLRRTFASLLVSSGVSVYKVARWMGDGVEVVERHYGHLQPSSGELDQVYEVKTEKKPTARRPRLRRGLP